MGRPAIRLEASRDRGLARAVPSGIGEGDGEEGEDEEEEGGGGGLKRGRGGRGTGCRLTAPTAPVREISAPWWHLQSKTRWLERLYQMMASTIYHLTTKQLSNTCFKIKFSKQNEK